MSQNNDAVFSTKTPGEPQAFESHYFVTDDGVPDGGIIFGSGFCISIQRGQVQTNEHGELEANGAFSQTLFCVLIDILENYQKTKFANPYNEEAITHLKAGQEALRRRLRDREEQGKLNTHNP